MKVVCKTNTNVHGYEFTNISVGKIYDVIEKITAIHKDDHIMILDDFGHPDGFPLVWFITLDEFRSEKIQKVLS